jgi:spermidine synthase
MSAVVSFERPVVSSFARARLRTISLFYVLSGALGLIYEVAFSKYLGYAFGATAYASSAVLVAFMGGLALGAYVAGRFERRVKNALLVYGIVEAVIGAFCVTAPWIFGFVTSHYVQLASKMPDSVATLTAVRALFAVVVVLVPAVGMGATLPLLARFVEGEDPANGTRRLAALYGINTAGGALGSLASSYLVIPGLGLALTMRVAASVSITIGLLAISLALERQENEDDDAEADADADADAGADSAADADAGGSKLSIQWRSGDDAMAGLRTAFALAAVSGVLVFGCEVVFTHLLALVIGTSVYAFGLMLAIFLVCLSLGTPLSVRLERRYKDGALSTSLAATGVALVLSLIVWDKLPGFFIALGPYVKSWAARETARGFAALFALLLPATLMGTTFPLVLRRARPESVGADVGKITAFNTIGSIAGSILFGFAVLPSLGSQRSIIAVAVAYAAAALYATREMKSHGAFSGIRRARLVAATAIALAILIPRWDLARLTSGANVYFDPGVVPAGVIEKMSEDVHGGVTTVVRDHDGQHTMLTNGKFQGNDSEEVQDNRGFAYLPAIFAKKREHALVIGLGTGTTTGAVSAFGFQDVDVAELSPAIVDYARTTFKKVNRGVLDDPHTHVLLEDGRNVLLVGNKQYDLVTIEVTSIWFAGAANLYNKEFYELLNARLTDDGVLQQWLQLHHTTRRTVATILATLREVFPHVALFVSGHQGHMIASRAPLTTSRADLLKLSAIPEVAAGLGDERLVDYVKGILLDETGIDRFLHDTSEETGLGKDDFISTDDNLLLEYRTPRGNVPTADDIPQTIGYLSAFKTRDLLLTHLTMK